ncbi:hypothetical protein HOP38_02650 [Vibrio mediterranei]|uniref:hypothetical protein n=1 Tax=Vibrio mediterranei TaxID=689 RepID=UPI0017B04087|nr:hypothetical protein [Vibrio mediterranei]NUW71410.1 hypothetical protein [Vibrio mediterranei]
MKHPTGREYSEYEMSLINGTAPTQHKPQSLIEIHYSAVGCRIAHQPRGNMERMRERQRKNNGSGRGLYAVVELPKTMEGPDLYEILKNLDGLEVQYQPFQGGDNFWNVILLAQIPPEKAHKHISEHLPNKEHTKTGDDVATVAAPGIKGIF